MSAKPILLVLTPLLALGTLAACGSSGGTDNPPAPPAPVTPPPPPEPTFEERLEDLAEHDPNDCRARTPGFEALGGWLANDGREVSGSRVWIDDVGELSDSSSHGATVWETFTDCAVRSTEDNYFIDNIEFKNAIRADGADLIQSLSSAPAWEDIELPEPGSWGDDTFVPGGILNRWHDGNHEGQRVLRINGAGNESGKRTSHLQRATFQLALEESDSALWLLVGGYSSFSTGNRVAALSSTCGDAEPLCLFGPWQGEGAAGTSQATPQVAATLDTVWTIWPDMDILDLRNLAFDCAENMTVAYSSDPSVSEEVSITTERTYSYSNGRTFTSTTNTTWGHGILSLTCLFTPNGGLQDPTIGNPISGGIFGPLAGPVTGAAITGVDYTGRDFGHGFARPVARENHAMAATANLRAVQAISGNQALENYAPGAFRGSLWQNGAVRVDLTGAGNAVGAAALWRRGGWILQSGLAVQPEGAGPLTGSRAFRAPATVSAALTAAYGRTLRHGLAVHLQADHWRTLTSQGRSLWQGADLTESRISAALVKRAGRHEFALQGVWRSGLSGSLEVDGRIWALNPRAHSGVFLTWWR